MFADTGFGTAELLGALTFLAAGFSAVQTLRLNNLKSTKERNRELTEENIALEKKCDKTTARNEFLEAENTRINRDYCLVNELVAKNLRDCFDGFRLENESLSRRLKKYE